MDVALNFKDGIVIKIADNGQGMDDDQLRHIFVRYYRGTSTSARPEGTGLGMAIAKEIIELHGGNIIATSQLEAGTTFHISFPYEN